MLGREGRRLLDLRERIARLEQDQVSTDPRRERAGSLGPQHRLQVGTGQRHLDDRTDAGRGDRSERRGQLSISLFVGRDPAEVLPRLHDGRFLQLAGRLAVGVPDDLASCRIGRIPGDPQQLQPQRVHPGRMEVIRVERHRSVGDGGVEHLPRRRTERDRRVQPAAAEHPGRGGVRLGPGADELLDLREVPRVDEVRATDRLARHQRVEVPVGDPPELRTRRRGRSHRWSGRQPRAPPRRPRRPDPPRWRPRRSTARRPR